MLAAEKKRLGFIRDSEVQVSKQLERMMVQILMKTANRPLFSALYHV